MDEAQNIPGIGKILKVINDNLPDLQIIATGSSRFDLEVKTSEPMTGRAFYFLLYLLSAIEKKKIKIGFSLNQN